MAKTKKKSISDVKLTKPIQKKKQNPFEVHINREKFKVLGQKSKFDKGLPGVARAKAVKKRKETLLQEYKVQDKSNKFIDRRIGERNKAMTSEDKVIARFTAERMKAHKRKAMFNLAEDEVLTHKGRSITEVERYDDPRSDEEDDYEGKTGTLDANFVEEAHFGGGVLTKSKNGRESVIDQLIADSKKRKLERQQTREKTLELTEKLDSEWRDLIPIVSSSHKRNDEEEEVVNKGRGDPFDIAMKELKFEARGKPSDKLKSEEEIAEQEAKRLKDLEEERLRRMRGEDTQVTITKRQHRSADALEDNFKLDDDDDYALVYDQDGNLVPPKQPDDENDEEDEEQSVITNTNDNAGNDNLTDDDDDDDEEEEEDEDDDEDEEEDDINDLKTEIEACVKEGEESEAETDEEIEETSIEKGKLSKEKSPILKQKEETPDDSKKLSKDSDDSKVTKTKPPKESQNKKELVEDGNQKKKKSSESNINENIDEQHKKGKCKESEGKLVEKKFKDSPCEKTQVKKDKRRVCFDDQVEEVEFGENAPLNTKNKTPEDIREDLMKRKELMDKARKELPFTYEAPKTYEELQELFKGHDQNEVIVIVERIIKCNHPKLREENKQKMSSLFAFLMQYTNDFEDEKCWAVLDRLVPYLYDLMMFSPSNIAECISEIIKEKQSDYAEKKQKYPPLSTLVFLKLVPLLFPASDKRHPVTTPALVFICQMLQNCKVNSRRSIATGLFLVSLFYECVSLSKRICPQVLNFLVGILHLASPASDKSNIVPPFKPQHRFLYLQKPCTGENADLKLKAQELSSNSSKIDDEFRIQSMFCCLSLIDLYLDLYESHHASSLLFLPFKYYLNLFEVSKYPSVFSEKLDKINEKLSKVLSQEMEKVAVSVKKPKALRLYEPSVQPVYDTKNRKGLPADKAEQHKLLHKIKREKKGALREIRRDKAFIAKIKFKQQQKSDTERIKKVKEIYSWGAQQQGEFNAFQRFKNKK